MKASPMFNPMSAAFFKKKYGFRLLLNEGRSFQHLVKTGKGEAQMWAWIEVLIRKPCEGMDISLRQKLLRASLDHDISPALMLASAGNQFSMIVRVPAAWRAFLRSCGLKIHCASLFAWQAEIIRKFLDGVRCYRRLCGPLPLAPAVPYAVLSGLHGNSYTSVLRNENAQDFLAWFRKCFPQPHYLIVPASVEAYETVQDCTFVPAVFPALPVKARAEFKSASRAAIFSALAKLCVGRWHDAYMLADRLEEIYMKFVPAQDLAKVYVFTNSVYIYRPLWTYEAERRGAKISLFFYSTNTFNITLAGGHANGNAPAYSLMSWPYIFTQHENHKKFLYDTLSVKADIQVAGMIPYEDNAADIDLPGALKIVYLDVQPFRAAFMASIGRPCHFYTEDISREAFQDLVSLARDNNAQLFIKPKRNVGKRLSPAYRKMLHDTEQKNHVKIIDPYISPQRLCQEADIVICQPFTTAALFAELAGKPVAYYDAQSLFVKDQLACQGIPLLNGREEMARWLGAQVLEIKNRKSKNVKSD